MAWTSPRTWIAGESLTAALLNTHLRDNMLVTEAALATGGGYFVGAAAKSITERKPKQAVTSGTTTTSSTTYTGSSPSVTVSTSDRALVMWSAQFSSNVVGGSGGLGNTWMSIAVSGATTIAEDDARSLVNQDIVADRVRQFMKIHFYSALTPGNNTFTAKYRVTGACTGSWADRRILVFPM